METRPPLCRIVVTAASTCRRGGGQAIAVSQSASARILSTSLDAVGQALAEAPDRRKDQVEVEEAPGHFLKGKAEQRPRRCRSQTDRGNARRPVGGEDDRLNHLADQQRYRLLHRVAADAVTPEGPAVVKDQLDAAVRNDRVGRSPHRLRSAFEEPETLHERRQVVRRRDSAYRIRRLNSDPTAYRTEANPCHRCGPRRYRVICVIRVIRGAICLAASRPR